MKSFFIGLVCTSFMISVGCIKASKEASANSSIVIDSFVTIQSSQGFKHHITAKKISSESIHDLYNDIKSFLDLDTINRNSVEIIIDSSAISPEENVLITFSISDNFLNNIPSGYTVAICSKLYQKEALDTGNVLYVYNTTFNKTNKTASVYAFNESFIVSNDGLNFLHGVFSFVTIPDNTTARITSNDCSILNWSWPTTSLYIAHGFSEPRSGSCNGQPRGIHGGLDIVNGSIGKLPIGTPVFAAADGKVITAKKSETAGNYIVIEHKPNIRTRYLHLDRLGASEGQTVYAGQEIGKSGNTGTSSDPHLHFDYSPGYGTTVCSNLFVDPLPCISECNNLCLGSCHGSGMPCGIDAYGNQHCFYPLNLNRPASNGNPPYQYKLNNGAWQTSSSFTILSPGTYILKVRDSKGCEATDILTYR